MTASLNQLNINKVAIVDDNAQNAEGLCIMVETCGAKPFAITGNFMDIDKLVNDVKKNYDGVLCDHRLGHRTEAAFTGAEAVARWFDMRFPAILVSEYTDFDSNTTIRQWRRKIPVVIPRDIFDMYHMIEGFSIYQQEIKNNPPPFRKPRKAFVRIISLGTESNMPFIEAIVPQWNHLKAVRFPKNCLGEFASSVNPDMLFIATVNIGARSADELFFEDFELAPEPDPNDGLA